MEAAVVDPLREPVDPVWDRFGTAEHAATPWRAELLTISAWAARTATLMITVSDGNVPVALFHGRLLGPHDTRSYARPGAVPPCAVFDCRLQAGSLGGHLFASGLDASGRAEAVTTFERTVRRRLPRRIGGFVYRRVEDGVVPDVRRRAGLVVASSPDLAVPNQWSDLDEYVRTRPTHRRWMRTLLATVGTDPTVRVEHRSALPATEVARLVDTVRRRHAGRTPAPPVPVPYFEALNADEATTFVSYRDDAGLLGMVTVHDDGRELMATHWGGRDRVDGGRKNLYFHSYLEVVGMMIRRRRERVQLGCALRSAKDRFGAVPSPRSLVVRR